jgi:hypothetical protein
MSAELESMMPAKKSFFILLATIFVMIGAGVALFFWSNGKKELHLVPQKRTVSEAASASDTEVGTGWSVKADPGEAVRQALAMALQGKKQAVPGFMVIFATSGADLTRILAETRKHLGDKTKIFGGTSDSTGVMTNRGFIHTGEKAYAVAGKDRGLAMMTVTSQEIVFGVGAADFSRDSSAREGTKTAILKAIKDCGKSPAEPPQAVLAVISRGFEEEALAGISEVLGNQVAVLGGTTGGPKFEVLGDREAVAQGVSLTVIYTKLPLGWVFEGGFDVPDTHRGVVTKMEGAAILEINGRPAVDVYDEWLGGKVKRLQEEGTDALKIRNFLSLNPFYRRYTSANGQVYFLFSVPWPRNKTWQDKAFVTSTEIKAGDEIFLSHGTWERLINRVGNLPMRARVHGGLSPTNKPLLGIGFICAGVMRAIPAAEREKMPLLMNYANNQAPFIVPFSWGEQGCFPGVGYKHGNLLTSFLVIGEKEPGR